MGNPFTNSATGKYTLYGTAFGFLFPVAATLLEAAHVFGEVTLASALHVQSQSALLWLMDTIPVGMGLCAWFAVTRKSLTPAASIPQPAGRDAPEFSAPGFWNPLGRILDSSFHELYVFGDDLKLIHVNQQALNNVGYSAEELIGLTPLDLLTETSREEFDSWIRPLRQGEKNLVTVVSVHRRKDGSQYPVEARIQMTRDETPAVFTVLLDDITQRHRHHENLQGEDHKLFQILDALPITFHLQAPDYSIPYANKLFRQRFGTPGGHPCYFLMHGRIEPCKKCPAFRVFDTGKEEVFRWQALDGRQYLTMSRPYMDFEQNPLVMEMTLDITGQEQARREVLNAKKEAKEACRAKSEFLARMSHNLRTPLNAILGFSQLLDMHGGTNFSANEKDHVRRIIKAGNHLLDLVNEVLDLSEIDSGKMDVDPARVNLTRLVTELRQLVQPMASSHQVKVEVLLPLGEEPCVLADPARLQQILLNLMTNAIKYNRPGGRASVHVGSASGGRVSIRVEDTGLGIPEEKSNLIFEPFQRLAEPPGKADGTGIGLAIAKKLTALMGGALRMQSTLGVGSCFTLEFPGGSAK